MFLIPAIDIIEGQCVRLKKGDFNEITYYSDNLLRVAQDFENAGAKFLHLVDLDGARKGKLINLKAIKEVLAATKASVQIGGGIRTFKDVEKLFKLGVTSVVLGTSVVEDQIFVKRVVEIFGAEKVLVALDFKKNELAISGWEKNSSKKVKDVLKFLKLLGLKTLIITDISRDGMLNGPNLALFKKFLDIGFEVIASGGVSCLNDLLLLKKLGVKGVIIGKALYEKKINLEEAIELVGSENFLAVRVIPCLDVKDGRVVKGIGFKNLRDIGDPVLFGKKYSDAGADELVFLDISATQEGRKAFVSMIKSVAMEINIPFVVGGGVSTIADVKRLLKAGADKVSIGSAAVTSSGFVSKVARYFGSQCIVVSIDVKREKDSWKVYIKGGNERTELDVVDFAKEMEKSGAGELLVNSLDRDGTKEGFDIEVLSAITKAVNIPVIASSGAGRIGDFVEVIKKAKVQAVLAASIFHEEKFSIKEVKQNLENNNINVRL